jgi:hypothetical protein
MLYAVVGERHFVNNELILKALNFSLDGTISLFLDCATCANSHKFADENLEAVFVIETESLYRFYPAIKSLKRVAKQVNAKKIFISTFNGLFDYDDDKENTDIFTDSWERIYHLSREFDIFVGVEERSIHEHFARLHNAKVIEMGHTITSQRMMVDKILSELNDYGKSLREEDRIIYAELLSRPLKHLGNISYASSSQVWAFILISILLEQEKKLARMHNEVKRLADGCLQDTR